MVILSECVCCLYSCTFCCVGLNKLFNSQNVVTELHIKISLAQLVERLAHRYSESTSSNPGNLTSATVCGDRTCCMLAAKRSASIAPEVDLGNVHYLQCK